VPLAEGRVRFHDLDLPDAIMHAVADLGFEYCTPIQAELLPQALAGSDTTGRAQTGTGKTAAFLIAIYTRLLATPLQGQRRPGVPRALILAPTRELVLQIEKDARDIGKYTDISIQPIFGGLDYDRQKRALAENSVDIMMATPGRLIDFQRQSRIRLDAVEILIIDEADRMLDMGFIPDVRKIVRSTPPKDRRQTMFFSATLTPEVERLADQWTRNPIHVEIEPEHVVTESVNQMVYIVTAKEKLILLLNLILGQELQRVLVFTNRKDQTVRLADRLKRYGIRCAVLSGDVPQKKRIQTLENFRNGTIRVLVATDVAARGLHIEGISHVINFTLPSSPDDYVHRIGRTGRAGATGISVSFACEDDAFFIPAIEEYIGTPLPCNHPDPSLLKALPEIQTLSVRKAAPARSDKRRFKTGYGKSGNRKRSTVGNR
jgi:ATP-dependent RNA helicase RhlB